MLNESERIAQHGLSQMPQASTANELPDLQLPGVSPEKLSEMQAYAAKLRKNSPKMKPARLTRKVAEHFKVKLV